MASLTYTKRNIEDWDFRHATPRSLPTDFKYNGAGSLFLMENYTEVLLVDHTRSIILKSMLDHKYAVFSDGRESILLTDFGEEMVGCHGGFTALRAGQADAFAASAKRWRVSGTSAASYDCQCFHLRTLDARSVLHWLLCHAGRRNQCVLARLGLAHRTTASRGSRHRLVLALYARASTRAAHRLMHGGATESDIELLGELEGKPLGEAFRAAIYGSDPQRDRIYNDIVGQLGGEDAALAMVQEHAEANDCEVNRETAEALLEGWRFKGIVQNISLGEYLDAAWAEIHAQGGL